MSPLLGRFSARALLLACAATLGLVAPSPGAAATLPASGPTVWGCFPGAEPNPCEGSQRTTYLSSTTLQPRKVAKVEDPPANPDPAVDCFYVYPTVVSSLTQNAPKRMVPEVQAILKFQAARFSLGCKVYAPIYRQATLTALAARQLDPPKGGAAAEPAKAFQLAYADVLGAWKDYLATHNRGRGVVLIGHSQGSALLIRLMHEEIDPDPAQRARLVSAIVPGGNLLVAKGGRSGGDLQNIPTCATGSETGCVIAYSSYATQPSRTALFGRVDSSLRASAGLPSSDDLEVACVNPAELSGDGGNFDSLANTAKFPGLIGLGLNLLYYGLPPKASTPWVSPGERYKGQCVRANDANVLRVRAANKATIVPVESPWRDWGLHLADINLPLGNLVKVVAAESATWAAAHPAS